MNDYEVTAGYLENRQKFKFKAIDDKNAKVMFARFYKDDPELRGEPLCLDRIERSDERKRLLSLRKPCDRKMRKL